MINLFFDLRILLKAQDSQELVIMEISLTNVCR
jgi:hypothetical protein